MSERMYGLQLSADQLIFLAEIFAVGYCNALRRQLQATASNGVSITAPLLETTFRENARDLLREPLRDPRFREELNKHFSTHPSEGMREFGWKWLQEILVWEE